MIEDNFKQYLKEKRTVHPNEDFDRDMMLLVRRHALNKSKSEKYLKLMYLFFLTGLLLGFIIAITLVDLELLIGNKTFMINKFMLHIPLVFILLFLFEKIYKATLVSIGKEKFSSI